jgi:hypothetical protein
MTRNEKSRVLCLIVDSFIGEDIQEGISDQGMDRIPVDIRNPG